jgi:hypothetical protein
MTSPFDKNWKSDINLRDMNNNNKRGMSVSRHVEERRKVNPTYGTVYGIGEIVVDQTKRKSDDKR